MLDFTTLQGEPELDFEGLLEEKTKLYTDAAANDAAAMASYLTEEETVSSFMDIRRDLLISGKSVAVEGIRNRDLEARQSSLKQAISQILVDPNINEETRRQSLVAATEIAGEDASQPIWKIFQDDMVYEHDGQDPEYNRTQDARFEEMAELRDAKELIDEIKLDIFPSLDGNEGSWIDMSGDMLEISVPLNFADTMQDLHKEMYDGQEFGWTGYVTIGEIVNKLKTTFSNIPNGPDKVSWAKRMVGFLKNNEGLLKDSNGFESFIAVNTLLDTSFVAGEDFDWDRLIENTVGVLDLAVIGSLVRSASHPLRMLGIINRTNPEKARVAAGAVLRNTDGQGVKTVNQSKASLIRGGHFPSSSAEALKGAPADVVGAVHEIDEMLLGVFNKYVVNNPSQARQLREIAETYGNGRVKVNDTHAAPVEGVDDAFNVSATIGRTRTAGYSTLGGARLAAKRRNLDPDTISFSKRAKSGKLQNLGDPIRKLQDKLKLTRKQIAAIDHNRIGGDPFTDKAVATQLKALRTEEKELLGKIKSSLDTGGADVVLINKLKGNVEKAIKDKTKELGSIKDDVKAQKIKNEIKKLQTTIKSFDKKLKNITGGKGLNEPGEFFYNVTRVEKLSPETPFIDFKEIATTILAPSGLRTRNFLDIFSIFKKGDALKLSRAEDLKHGVQAQIRGAALAFDKLPEAGKVDVLALLKQGAEKKKVYSWEEAVGGTEVRQAMTNDAYIAYQNIRSVSDLAYNTENVRVVDWLKNNNYKTIVGEDGINMFGTKVVKAEDVNAKAVINSATGESTELTKGMLDSIRNGMGELYKLRAKERRGLDSLEYVYVDRRNLKQVKDIPEQSLPYIDGYVHRRYEDDFFIERHDPRITTNGGKKASKSEQTSVVGRAARPSEADEYLEMMKRETLTPEDIAEGVTLEIRFGREAVANLSEGEAAFKFAGMNGLLHKGTRGPLLNSLDTIDSNVTPILQSIGSSMNKAAGNLSIRPVVEKLEADFVSEYKRFIDTANDGVSRFPLHQRQFFPAGNAVDKKIHKQMLAAWEYINFLGRFEDPVTKNWRANILDIANWMDGKAWSNAYAVKQLKKTAHKDPLDVLKGSTFTAFLALNPTRQLIVQLSQHMMLAPLDPKYFVTGRVYKDTATLLYGAAIRTNKKLWKAQSARLAEARGLSVKQYTDEVDGWMNSGLPTGVDSHNFLGGMLLESTELAGKAGVDRAVAAAGNALKAPFRLSRKVGFNAGEVGNLALSYHIARRRLEKAGTVFTRADVADEARALSLGMNRAGELRYQRGYLKLTTQFFSMQHKAMLTILNAATGGKKGNRFFTSKEAQNMAAMQLLIFGAEGLGVGLAARKMADMYEDAFGEPMEPETREILTAGLGTYMINGAFSMVDGLEGTRLDFSSIAPMSGSTMMIESIFDMMGRSNEATIGQILGASSSFLMRTHDSTVAAWDILQFPDPDLTNVDKIIGAMKQLSTVSSGLNNYYKGHLALQEGVFRDKHGNATVRATAAEAWGQILIGFGTYDKNEYYRLRMDVAGMERARKDQARRTAATINNIYQDNKHLDFTLLREKLVKATLWMNLQSVDERQIFRSMIVDELRKQAGGDTGAEVLINRIIKGGTFSLEEFGSKIGSVEKDPKKMEVINKLIDYAVATPKTNLGVEEEDKQEKD